MLPLLRQVPETRVSPCPDQPPAKSKLYCYVDETGQDTKGRFFLVALVITGAERDQLSQVLESIERESAKGIAKWKRTSSARRSAYLQQVMRTGVFRDKIRYATFSNRRDYREMIIQATAQTIVEIAHRPYRATILIDGLVRGFANTVTYLVKTAP